MEQNNYNNVQNPNVESGNMVQPNIQEASQMNSMPQYNVQTPQQPVPQYVSNEPQNLSITPKKNNKKVLFIVLGVLLIVVAVVVTILLLNKDSKKEQNKEEKETNVVDGNVELIMSTTEEYPWNFTSEDYFAFETEDKARVIDCDGNEVFSSKSSYYIHEIGDGYFFDNFYFDIYANNELFLGIRDNVKLPFSYKDKIFYYDTVVAEQHFITALDTTKKEVVWKTEGHSPSILTNDIIVAMYGNEEKIQLLSKDGKIIVQEKDNEKIYVTSTDIYFKVINDSEVEIYDFNNNLLSSKKLNGNESFDNSLSAGFFITKTKVNNNSVEYKIYDRNFKIIDTFNEEYTLLNYPYPKHHYAYDDLITKSFNDENKSVIIFEYGQVIYVFADGTTKHIPYSGNFEYLSVNSYNDYYFDMLWIDEQKQLINFDNNKIITVPNDLYLEAESPNGNYVIMEGHDNYYYIYDSNLELVYEFNSERFSVYDDNHIINVKDGEIFLINVFDGTKAKLNVNGSYVDNNSCGLVTKDGEKYNLYKVN